MGWSDDFQGRRVAGEREDAKGLFGQSRAVEERSQLNQGWGGWKKDTGSPESKKLLWVVGGLQVETQRAEKGGVVKKLESWYNHPIFHFTNNANLG